MHVDQIVTVIARADFVDHHRQRMRQFVANSLQRGLADEFGHQHLFGFVGQLTVGVIRRARRQRRGQHVDQHVDLLTGRRRHRDDLGCPVPTSSLTATSCAATRSLGTLSILVTIATSVVLGATALIWS